MITTVCFRLLAPISLLLFSGSAYVQNWKTLSDRIDSLSIQGQIQKAYKLAKLNLEQAQKEFGKTHTNYGVSLSIKGQFLQEMGDYKQAE